MHVLSQVAVVNVLVYSEPNNLRSAELLVAGAGQAQVLPGVITPLALRIIAMQAYVLQKQIMQVQITLLHCAVGM